MKIFKTKTELSSYLSLNSKLSISFVPTMGALHNGHLSLVQEAKSNSDIVICSIFVNPTQFNNKADFKNYPTTLDEDLYLLKMIKCDIVYVPDFEDLYTPNEYAKQYDFNGLDKILEGKFRKGHFNGVATIVEKFLEIIKPNRAFFGQKDLQQLIIIKYLVKKLNIPTQIISVPTVRENNGIAMSSRNVLLNKRDLNKAAILHKSLLYCKENARCKSIAEIKRYIISNFKKDSSLKLEYIEFVNASSLKSLDLIASNGENAVCIAAFVSGVRLIDNIIF